MGFAVVLATVALVLGPPAPTSGATAPLGRDDTATLQAQLDAGGTVYLPALPDGQCYATHGLWASLDGTSVVSDTAVQGLTIENCLLSGADDTNYLPETGHAYGNPAAGIDVEPNSPGDPITGVRIAGNRIEGNAGPGILLALQPGPAVAPSIEISGNTITGNGLKTTPPGLGGIVPPAGD